MALVKHYQVWYGINDVPHFKDVYGANSKGEAMRAIVEQFPEAELYPQACRYFGKVDHPGFEEIKQVRRV